MTAKIKNILSILESIITFEPDSKITDDDFIANIDAINLLYNISENTDGSRKTIRQKMTALYPEFSRRIYGKKDIQQAIELIKALYRFIYGRGYDEEACGPKAWRNSLIEMCCKAVYKYKQHPAMHSGDYLYCLLTSTRLSVSPRLINTPALMRVKQEYQKALDGYLSDIDSVDTPEKLRRVAAMQEATEMFGIEHKEKWEEAKDSIKTIEIKKLSDRDFLIWTGITERTPMRELKKRAEASSSTALRIEYLSTQATKP